MCAARVETLTERRRLVETSVGRALLSEILPKGLSFDLINIDMTKKAISATINACYRALGLKETVVFADQLMYTGFHYATRSGVSFGIDDIVIPEQKTKLVAAADREVKRFRTSIRPVSSPTVSATTRSSISGHVPTTRWRRP